ncbi:hypothetical protein KR51_00024010 [Rubidibacter lacunae KORDI 51-2]|uniref:DUF1232 domain-containing protein n=2 Tax=Rubidibacter TaxID=582491 RepID=U5DJR4_9CHRO|nr:hypothetical protein KR51_00024010 [Rubidibacter lacunae KORDI 51-2]
MKFPMQSVYTWYRHTLRNPKYRMWIVAGTLVYLLSPLDIAPDVFPIVGQIDDFAVLAIFVSEVSGLLFDAMKSRKPNPNEASPGQQTVDVDAVSVD